MTNDLGAILDLTWKLLLVLGLAVLATRALRWIGNPTAAPDAHLKILARLGVGAQQSVILVGIGSKRLVLGVTSQQISVLAELTADELPDVLVERAAGPRAWTGAMGQLLNRASARPGSRAVAFSTLLERAGARFPTTASRSGNPLKRPAAPTDRPTEADSSNEAF